jgi:hypothetical protein
LVLVGSRATGDALPDSDYDAIAYVHDIGRAKKIDLAALERSSGKRLGVTVWPLTSLRHCARGHGAEGTCFLEFRMLSFGLGRARVIGGRNVLRSIPPAKSIIGRGLQKELQADYWYATLPDSWANVFKREPRRHVGFIIAICDSLLKTKGVNVNKAQLPQALKRHHPKFRVIGLLKRALGRRAHWPEIGQDRQQIAGARRDVREFLRQYRHYVFGPGGQGLTAAEAMHIWREARRQMK